MESNSESGHGVGAKDQEPVAIADGFGHDGANGTHIAGDGTHAAAGDNDAAGSADADQKAADRARARAAGWTECTAVDYDQYARSGGNDGNWAGTARVYEWKDEYGDVGPKVPELETMLFGGEFRMRRGEHVQNLELQVTVEGPTRVDPIREFDDAGFHPAMLNNIQLAQYEHPTPIQCYTIPAVLQGTDVVGIAQTGSGKTAAYLIPILSKLMGKAKKMAAPRPDVTAPGYDARIHKVKAEPLVVIVVPTRELAIQVFDEARRLCYRSMLRPCVAYGGLPMGKNRDELGAGCDIIIATPGRLCDLMDKPDIITMSRVKYTVIDEADEMLSSDWEEELRKIMAGGDTNEDADHVYLMFSATFPKQVRSMAREYMAEDYARIRIGRAGSAHRNIRQTIVQVDQDMKRDAVYDLLFAIEPARTLIFCNSKIQVDLLDDFLYNRGLPTTSIHGDRAQIEREDAMRAFRTGRAPILIATGISGRGWDIPNVKNIINYDLPSGMYGGITEYVHRIGRTARIGHQGLATSFYNDRNDDIAQDLVNVLIECDCEVPDFLQHLVPEDGKVNFDDDSDGEANEGEGTGATDGAGGGFGEAAGAKEGVAVTSAWGAAPIEAADTGFTADAGFTPDAGATAGGW